MEQAYFTISFQIRHKTYTVKGESCIGRKMSKKCLTVLLFSNSDGSEKLTLHDIGRAKKPRCFKNIIIFPTSYKSYWNSWMREVVFQYYFGQLEKKMQSEYRKIILFVDQCSTYQNVTLKNVRLEFSPSNYSILCDLGIIHSFKVAYRQQTTCTKNIVSFGILSQL